MKLDKYISQQLVVGFLIAAGGMLFIALPGIAVGAVHRFGGVSTLTVAKFIPLAVAGFAPYVLPVAFLLSVVATYGRMAADREWTAILMAGIHPFRMLFTALVVGLVVSGGVYFLNSEALPWINYHQQLFKQTALRDVIKNLNPGKTEVAHGKFYLTANHRIGDTFYDVFIEMPDMEDEAKSQSLFAARASFAFEGGNMIIELHDVDVVREGQLTKIAYSRIVQPLSSLVKESTDSFGSPRYKNSGELLHLASDPDMTEAQRQRFLYAFHERIANAATCLLFVLLGVPTGVLLRRGTQLAALAIAVGYALLYWIFTMRLGEELSAGGALPAAAAAWAPFGIWMAAAIALAWRVLNR